MRAHRLMLMRLRHATALACVAAACSSNPSNVATLQQAGTLVCEGGIPVETLTLQAGLGPQQGGQTWLYSPSLVPVVLGYSSDAVFTMEWSAPTITGGQGICVYKGNNSYSGGGSSSMSPLSTSTGTNPCIDARGTGYNLWFCTTAQAYKSNNCSRRLDTCATNAAVLGATSIPHGGLIGPTVNGVVINNFAGDPCSPTVASFRMTSPSDADGDGLTECVAPTWPNGSTLTAQLTGPDTATLTWTPATDDGAVAGYRLYQDGVLVSEVGSGILSVSVAGLAPNATYHFQVQAFDALGNESTSGPATTLSPDGLAPTWPSGSVLSATATGGGTGTFVWTAAADNVAVAGYRVYQDGALVREVDGATLSATVSGLATEVTYQFQVQAFDAAGNQSTTGPATTLRLDGLAPTWPAGSTLTGTRTGPQQVTLVWTAATDSGAVAGYRLYKDAVLVAEVDGATLTAAVMGLSSEVDYAFQVQAFDGAGNASQGGPQATVRIDGLAPIWPPGSVLTATPVDPVTAVLVWTAASDNVGVAGYRIHRDGWPIRDIDATTLIATVTGLAPFATLRVQAFDAAGNVSSDGPQATFTPDLSAPSWPADATLTVVAAAPRAVSLSWSAASDTGGILEYRVVQDAIVVRTTAPTQRSVDITALDPEQTYTFRVDAVDPAGNVAAGPSASYRLGTVDPALQAPALDPRVSATLFETTRFLYDGPDAVQQGVTPGAIAPNRVALLRGRVLDRGGAPIRDVTVRVHGRPDLGHTRTRLDGVFDLVVNGGGALTLAYDHPGYFSVHRELAPDWQATLHAPDVILISEDVAVTEVDSDVAWLQVAQGTRIEDDDGERQATLLFPPATAATMRLPDGTMLPLETMHVRATEYTVGGNGPAAMPAELPKASAYTYAVELQVDEARAAGATEVTFSQPVIAYLENYLGIPVGEVVPSGYYDRQAAQWIPAPNGRVIKILADSGVLADIDVDGDGAADTAAQLAALGITDGERAALANLYEPGAALWRVPVAHFSPWDWNMGWGPDGDGTGPPEDASLQQPPENKPNVKCGSVIECENQVLGEQIDISGTGLSLVYSSFRKGSRSVERSIRIPLTGPTVPRGLLAVEAMIDVAGQRHTFYYPPQPNESTTFTWDGKDAFGRELRTSAEARVTVSNVYGIVYRRTPGFGLTSVRNSPWSVARAYSSQYGSIPVPPSHVKVSRTTRLRVGTLLATTENTLGGWTISAEQQLDRGGRTIHFGDGTREVKTRQVVKKLNGTSGIVDMVVAADGTVYAASDWTVWRVSRDGITQRYAGSATTQGFAGDGGPATAALLRGVKSVALAPDGTLYIKDGGNHRIRRVTLDGIITTIAGNGVAGTAGDGGPALLAQLDESVGLELGSDGAVYVNGSDRIRRIDPDGTIRLFAGGFAGSRSLAIDREDRLYFLGSFGHKLLRIAQDGSIVEVAGRSVQFTGIDGDGGPATQAGLQALHVSVGADGAVYLVEANVQGGPPGSWLYVVRRIDYDGIIRRFIGNGGDSFISCGGTHTNSYNRAPLEFPLCLPAATAVGPANTLVVAEGPGIITVAGSALDALSANRIPSSDGAELYEFDAQGRHVRTFNTLVGSERLTFDRDADGRLATVADPDGNSTTIAYSPGRATITAPFGQRSELFFDARGNLERVSDPIGESVTLTYHPERPDLLASFSHPFSGISTFSYDAEGRLLRDTAASGAYQEYGVEFIPGGRKVTRTTRLNRNNSYERTVLLDGSVQRRITDPANLVRVEVRDTRRKTVTISADGTRADLQESSDPRFGVDSDIATSARVTLPSGRSVRADSSTAVNLANPADPLSLSAKSVTTTTNGSQTMTTTYSSSNRTITTITPEGRQSRSILDTRGRVVDIYPPGMARIHYEYDTRGRVRQVTQGSRTQTATYDSDGRLDTLTSPDNRTVALDYDAIGRLRFVTRPDGGVLEYAYENGGRRTLLRPPGRPAHLVEVAPEAQTSDYAPPIAPNTAAQRHTQFDDDHLVSSLAYGAGSTVQTVTVVRDAAGRAERVLTPRGTFAYSYDDKGRLQHQATPEGVTTRYSYDGTLLTGITLEGPVQATVNYEYDTALRVQSEAVNASTVTFDYDNDDLGTRAADLNMVRDPASGVLVGQTIGELTSTLAHNEYGEVDDQRVQFGPGTIFRAEVLERDGSGRIKSRRESLAGVVHVYDYSYDVLGRLTAVSVDSVPAAHYEYEDNGSRVLSERGNDVDVVATYDAQDRLLSNGSYLYTYTQDGALESKTDTRTDQTTHYVYDLDSRLLSVTLPSGDEIDYVLDAQGRRIGRKVNGTWTSRWIYGSGPAPIAEVDALGEVTARYVYGMKPWVPDYVVRGELKYALITDNLGSVRAVIDVITGDIVQQTQYDEFGRVSQSLGSQMQPFGFGGGLYDELTGLVRLGARDYDPEVGRWTTKDPVLFAGGTTNLYGYCYDDPVNCIDPEGLVVWAPVLACALNPACVATVAEAATWTAAALASLGFALCAYTGQCALPAPDDVDLSDTLADTLCAVGYCPAGPQPTCDEPNFPLAEPLPPIPASRLPQNDNRPDSPIPVVPPSNDGPPSEICRLIEQVGRICRYRCADGKIFADLRDGPKNAACPPVMRRPKGL